MQNRRLRLLTLLGFSLLLSAMLLSACSATATSVRTTEGAPTTTAVAPTNTANGAAATVTSAPTTAAATAAPTTAPATRTTETAPTKAPVATTAPATAVTTAPNSPAGNLGSPWGVDSSLYIDDRSNAIQLVRSFYNAINRKEYVRAYSYWGNSGGTGSPNLPAYADFEKGYANTASVQFYTAPLYSGAAAGTTSFTVPFALKTTQTNGAEQYFAGCYLVLWPTPINFGNPPLTPMNISNGNAQTAAANANFSQLALQSCQKIGAQTNNPYSANVPADPALITAENYLDDRSKPEQVLRSFYNAINRKEYVRAYSYWRNTAASAGAVPAYPQFEQGYTNTASVQLTFGKVTGSPGAGQLYYTVPVILNAKQANGTTQNFVGCYTLHQSQPANFGAPPFVPMGIEKGNLQPLQTVPADTAPLLTQACANQ